ncbi:MAG: dihydroorotase [Oscillospiraceae bacterium]|nr:dihydroorotase [Oscillospiraceae bacterium]
MIISNANLVDWRGERKGDLCIEDGIISKTGGGKVINAAGLYALPAFVDLHTHLRTPGLTHKETAASGARAALRGGYTTLNAMANTRPVCSNTEIAREAVTQADGICDVYQAISATKDFDGKTVAHLDALDISLNEEKQYIKSISEDGYGIASGGVFLEVLHRADKLGMPLLVHAEDAALSAVDMYAAEDLETIRDLYLVDLYCKKYGAGNLKVHFCHVSTEFSMNAIIDAKRRGLPVTLEVTPHHIALNDSTDFRVNPPLRRESDRMALINSILDGQIDAIATDHAPHTAQDKLNGAPGLVGLETAFSVCYTTLCRQNNLPLSKLSELMSRNPARLLGINKGTLDIGMAGDVVLVNLEREITVDSSKFASKGRNTPFDGHSYFGEVVMTIYGGDVL